MRDSTKILLLGGIAILFACLFIGIGLTADNYQYFCLVEFLKYWR